ncbi:MAG: hypothetical protein ACJ8G7_22925, partial [Rhizobacter sp.]
MPVVHCRGVRIANAGWAQTARPLAALAEVVAVMSWRSFSERRPVVELMTLREGEVDLELQADGLRNWRLMRPEDRGPGRFKILSLTAERTNLRFVHGGLDLQLEATTSAATIEAGAAPGPTPPIRVVLDGAWRGLPFAADLGVEPPLTFIETGRQARLRGWIRSGGAQLDVDGRAGDLLRQPRIDAHVAFAGASLAPFHAFIGRRGAAPLAFRGEGELQVSADAYALKDMRARIGRSDMAGELAFTSAADRGMVRASLASDLLDLDDL